jgi:hypothetical protein
MPYDLIGRALYPLSQVMRKEEFPLADYVPQEAIERVFDGLFYTDAEAYTTEDGFHLNVRLAFEDELSLRAPNKTWNCRGDNVLTGAWQHLLFPMNFGP